MSAPRGCRWEQPTARQASAQQRCRTAPRNSKPGRARTWTANSPSLALALEGLASPAGAATSSANGSATAGRGFVPGVSRQGRGQRARAASWRVGGFRARCPPPPLMPAGCAAAVGRGRARRRPAPHGGGAPRRRGARAGGGGAEHRQTALAAGVGRAGRGAALTKATSEVGGQAEVDVSHKRRSCGAGGSLGGGRGGGRVLGRAAKGGWRGRGWEWQLGHPTGPL